VSDIATKDVVRIEPDQDVEEARRLLAQHQLDRLVVVEEGDRLVGIIPEADLRRDEGPWHSSATNQSCRWPVIHSGDPLLWMHREGWPGRVAEAHGVTRLRQVVGCCSWSWVVRRGRSNIAQHRRYVMGVDTTQLEDEEIKTVWPRVRAQGGATVSDGDSGDDADSGDSGGSDSRDSGSDSDSDSGDSGDDSDSTDR
jgi:CBS domain